MSGTRVELYRETDWTRFWSKVDFAGDCWEWTGLRNDSGYGRFWLAGHHYKAHRVAYAWLVGFPAALTIDHLCRNHACVNPAHLDPVPMGVNARRGMAGPINAARLRAVAHCPQDHPYDEANTYTDARGKRNCRACARVASARYRAARRVA